jgi:EAL domain-containing protein (putative c-di-GMP-specific phosphodiesterase class I)
MAKQSGGADDLRTDLEGAIDRGEFRLEFQPVVRLGGGQVAGAEALVRWRHPRRGTIAPNEFLPLAEESGQIDAIGEFVLGEATRAAATWPRSNERPGFVSVNVTPNQMKASGAATRMLRLVNESGLEPRLLTVELTSGLTGDATAIVAALDELREAGVGVALDDFGMATSLADLKRLPVDQVKLAREFVGAINGPAEDSAFALSLINIADVRGVDVVAKGVESREQAWRLAELGCRYGQGFFFSKPLGASGVLAVLRQGTLRG